MQLPGKRDCCWTTTADVTSFTNLKHSGKTDVAIVAEPFDWPSPETLLDDDLFTAATVLFLQPARARRAKRALRIALGGEQFELLVGLLTFVRSAHYWTLMHPELALEDDVKELLR